jgi:hypothetical protein
MRDGVSEHKPSNRVACQRTCTGRMAYSHCWRSRLCLRRRRERQKARCYAGDGNWIRKARPSASRSIQLRLMSYALVRIALSLRFFPAMPYGHLRGGCRLFGGVRSARARKQTARRTTTRTSAHSGQVPIAPPRRRSHVMRIHGHLNLCPVPTSGVNTVGQILKKDNQLKTMRSGFLFLAEDLPADIGGWRARELMAPLFVGDDEELQALIRDHLILPYLFGDFHPSHIPEYAGGLLIALEKPANPDGSPGGLRPIICGESWRRCLANLAAAAVRGPISKIFTSTYENFLQTAGLQNGASHCAKILSAMYASLNSDPSDPASPKVRHPYPAPCHGAAHQELGALQGPASALRRHTLGGTTPASPPSEAQGHSRGLHPARGDEWVRGASRQCQGPRALLGAPLMAWHHQAHICNDAFDPALWETFTSTTLGLEVPTLAALPRLHNSPLAKCGCRKFCMDFPGDHTSTCTGHSGATKANDWMVSVIWPLYRTAGHLVRTHHGVTASAGQRRGDVEVRSYLRDQAGSRTLVSDLSITHDRFGSNSRVQQNGSLLQKLCSPNGGLSRLSPGSGCPLRAGMGHGRPGRAPGWC